MLHRLLVLLALIPIIELLLLIELGRRVGTLPVFVLIIITGLLGILMTRLAGLSTWYRIRDDLRRGQLPSEGLLDGLMVLVGSVLLIVPGILSDLLGLLLLVPVSRSFIRVWLRRRARRWIEDGSIRLIIR